MTEAEWSVCTDLTTMLEFLQGKVGDRKLRLFACACCHAIDYLLTDERLRHTLQIAERFADGQATLEERQAARRQADAIWRQSPVGTGRSPHAVLAERDAAAAVKFAASNKASFAAASAAQCVVQAMMRDALLAGRPYIRLSEPGDVEAGRSIRKSQPTLLHDLFGRLPFRPIAISPSILSWDNGIVVKLAQAIYEERAFDRMSILADALEEAGCEDADLLAHCREPRQHVRGCWVVDLLLGRGEP